MDIGGMVASTEIRLADPVYCNVLTYLEQQWYDLALAEREQIRATVIERNPELDAKCASTHFHIACLWELNRQLTESYRTSHLTD